MYAHYRVNQGFLHIDKSVALAAVHAGQGFEPLCLMKDTVKLGNGKVLYIVGGRRSIVGEMIRHAGDLLSNSNNNQNVSLCYDWRVMSTEKGAIIKGGTKATFKGIRNALVRRSFVSGKNAAEADMQECFAHAQQYTVVRIYSEATGNHGTSLSSFSMNLRDIAEKLAADWKLGSVSKPEIEERMHRPMVNF